MQLFRIWHLTETLIPVLGLAASAPTTTFAHTSDSLSSVPVPIPISLQKRGYELSLIHFDQDTIITPVSQAAVALAHFYTQVAIGSRPNGPWSRNTPRIMLRITLGALQLLMTASEPLTIPWNFVEWHALQMLEMAQRGYSGTYHAYYVPADGVGRIVVSLTYNGLGVLGKAGFGAVGDAVSGAVNGAASGAGQALNANAKPFIPNRAFRRIRDASMKSRDGPENGRGRNIAIL